MAQLQASDGRCRAVTERVAPRGRHRHRDRPASRRQSDRSGCCAPSLKVGAGKTVQGVVFNG